MNDAAANSPPQNKLSQEGHVPESPPPRIAITGTTGYVGGRLWKRLAAQGESIRCLVRNPAFFTPRIGEYTVEVAEADVLKPETLRAALEGIHEAYYLVHAMGAGEAFEDQERIGATNFAREAARAGLKRIIYVGGLAPDDDRLSRHMRSRHATGRALASAGVPVVELRASIVIGAGSLSYEMIRALVQKLPFMVTPNWTRVLAQPIYIDDLLSYLVEARTIPVSGHDIHEIGGGDVISYYGLMQEYARRRGRHITALPVSCLSPRLSSLWLGLVTPLYARIGRKLIDSCSTPSIIEHPVPAGLFTVKPVGVEEAIRRAQENEDRDFQETRWSDPVSSAGHFSGWGGKRFGTRLVDSRSIDVDAAAQTAFQPIQSIGGEKGYYCANGLWRLRGWIDMLVGGVGMRRGRKHGSHLHTGDAVDFWRVEHVEPGRVLRLQAEMRLPGRAWLQFEVTPVSAHRSTIRQTAIFDPIGAWGLVYWYGVYPLHELIFRGMLRGLAREALRASPDSNHSSTSPDEDGN